MSLYDPARNLSIWLLPSATSPECREFSKVVDYLAKKNGKTPYAPHATLAMLPADFPLEIVRDVVNETKRDWFSRRIEFEKVYTTSKGVMIRGRHDTVDAAGVSLGSFQQAFHDRLQEEVQKRRTTGTIAADTPDVKNIVPKFPHISLAYTDKGQEESVKDIKKKGWYKPLDGGIKIAGFKGYKIGAIHFVYCGGLKPEKWKLFEQIEDGAEAPAETST
ncbi:hypothetical protein M408DRAFT_25254 [Serendipita vermifera MAFF 305830]|uniref:2',3'-cyclic-nucleotide 3'-phosphodiesterase n=1 Tax=Serendipita vermifera MAFF 305830 TaxID=933852 RepID=A0A0C2WJP2_SERVB|nr:hypothetical protein M408DRAFT_25254 [Serendipita vermifera MAFF 305830]